MVTNESSSPSTVAELLGLPVEDGIYAQVYLVGSEPSTPSRRRASTRARRVKLGHLDSFLEDARAGASDEAIAKAAGVTSAQVGRWRRERDVGRRRGRPNLAARATSVAVELLGHPFKPVVAHVRTSIIGGRFEPPQYVLRDGLEYELLVELVGVLACVGYDDSELARGLGIRPRDVAVARALGSREA